MTATLVPNAAEGLKNNATFIAFIKFIKPSDGRRFTMSMKNDTHGNPYTPTLFNRMQLYWLTLLLSMCKMFVVSSAARRLTKM